MKTDILQSTHKRLITASRGERHQDHKSLDHIVIKHNFDNVHKPHSDAVLLYQQVEIY
jgi:hypothetical protein